MVAYADYNYYINEYKGGIIKAAVFNQYALWASNLVDMITFGRVRTLPEIPDMVKDAVCAAAECYSEYREKASRQIKSESNDGYSVSYADAGTEKSVKAEALGIIRVYLSNSGLLFRGREAPDD